MDRNLFSHLKKSLFDTARPSATGLLVTSQVYYDVLVEDIFVEGRHKIFRIAVAMV